MSLVGLNALVLSTSSGGSSGTLALSSSSLFSHKSKAALAGAIQCIQRTLPSSSLSQTRMVLSLIKLPPEPTRLGSRLGVTTLEAGLVELSVWRGHSTL